MDSTKEVIENVLQKHIKGIHSLLKLAETNNVISEDDESQACLLEAQLQLLKALMVIHNPQIIYDMTEEHYIQILENLDSYLNDEDRSLIERIDNIPA